MVNCPLKDKNYNGNCDGCNNRAYCMMSEIIEKLHSLEIKLGRIEAAQVQ
jgi:hypothetical protein